MAMLWESNHSAEVRKRVLSVLSAICAKTRVYDFIRVIGSFTGITESVGVSFIHLPFL